MKKLFLFTAVIMFLATGFASGQSIIDGYRMYGTSPPYDPRTPPPMTLPDAYALSQMYLGNFTSRWHCVSVNCLELTNNGLTGWKFVFSNTNGTRAKMEVYFDKIITSDFARSHSFPDVDALTVTTHYPYWRTTR